MQKRLFVGIELGGTKTLCRIVDERDSVVLDRRFATSAPAATVDEIDRCVANAVAMGGVVAGVGVASFGPIVVDRRAHNFGHLLATPKAGWSDFDLHAALRSRLGATIAIDTDVNAAARAEQVLGAGKGFDSVAYVTVGTGIGGGLATNEGTFKGSLHPEIGHIRLRRRRGDDSRSACPFHDDCAEGLASGSSIAQRLGPMRVLADSPATQTLIAGYLGDLMATLVLAWAPHRIVLGGGVLATSGLLAQIGDAMRAALAEYGPVVAAGRDYLAPAHFVDAGLEGALIMARKSEGDEGDQA